jgi:hypothetical protein
MFARSFRLDTARLIPRPCGCKQALLLAVLILAGCGGSGAAKADYQSIAGSGYRFDAPAGWRVEHAPRRVAASSDSELVQVATFPLVRAYDDSLFTRVEIELGLRMRSIAQQTGGKVSGRKTVTAGGVRSHAYDVTVGDHVDEYTFVLRGKREYQLLCRRRSSSSDAFCAKLVTSFAPA